MSKKGLDFTGSEAGENYYKKLDNIRDAYKFQIAKVRWIMQGERGNYPWDENRWFLSL